VVSSGCDGLLVGFGRHVELADAVSRLLADAELRHRLGEAGRRKVLDEYTWDAVFGRFARVIDPLLARNDDCSSG
jgi:glycosyltransferase involved in cell wall biosynthesis